MATRITNQATLNYTSDTNILSTISNTASVTLHDPLEVVKYALEGAYKIGEEITYNVFISNTATTAITNITVVDDLGTYAVNETFNVTPLTYTGPAKIFTGNLLSGETTGVVSAEGDSVTFTIPTLAAGSTLLLQYNATVNQYAGAVLDTSIIENIVSVTATRLNIPVIAETTLPVDSYAQVEVKKTMSPDPVVDGSTLTYTFVMSNYGTIDATDATLGDVFNPAPVITSVTVDGTAATDYSYDAGVFTYPATSSAEAYTIPSATFTQDTTTGVVAVIPGTSTIIAQGTI